ncbi:MAG: hypothetical protein ACFFDH_03305 [Promethearchaeota archaeon]
MEKLIEKDPWEEKKKEVIDKLIKKGEKFIKNSVKAWEETKSKWPPET